MAPTDDVRVGWLKGMYLWTILGAGGFGLGLLLAPELMRSVLGYPSQDPAFLGIVGSVAAAFGILSILGFFAPLKFIPVLVLQLVYKTIWFILVFLPAVAVGQVQAYGWILAAIFATYVVGDLIVIPFSYVFEGDQG